MTDLLFIPRVATDPTPPAIGLPLPGEAATVTLVVVVVGGVVEAIPPHRRSGGRLYQSAVAPAQSGIEESAEKYEEHLAMLQSTLS